MRFSRPAGPPDAKSVMKRLIVIKYQVIIGLIKADLDVRAEAIRELKAVGVWSVATPDERAFLKSSIAEVSHQTVVDVSWLMESAECLLWALKILDGVPPYDTQSDTDHLNLLPDENLERQIASAQLRPLEELEDKRGEAELWHWRSRTRKLQESGEPIALPNNLTLDEIVKISSENAASRGLFPAPIGDDFPAFGKPYRALSQEEWFEARSIAMERHRAFNWLCGYAPKNRWDETPTDT